MWFILNQLNKIDNELLTVVMPAKMEQNRIQRMKWKQGICKNYLLLSIFKEAKYNSVVQSGKKADFATHFKKL